MCVLSPGGTTAGAMEESFDDSLAYGTRVVVNGCTPLTTTSNADERSAKRG